MIIIHNKIIPFGNYKIINLFSMLFTKSKNLSDKDINHERIHSYQMLELGILGCAIILLFSFVFDFSFLWSLCGILSFYLWYCVEYVIVRFFHTKQNSAYHDISLEEEAYENDDNLTYIQSRKWFNWLKYIKIKSYKK